MSNKSFLTIDLGAISNNVDVLKSYLTPDIKLMAVVKADAYGHGAVEVAQKIAPDVYGFAVNDLREGIELRENGIELPILIFEPPEKETVSGYKNYHLCATVSEMSHFQLLPEGVFYYLNFNTGMGRLGFRPDQAEDIAGKVKNHDELECQGIYSHFPEADEIGSTKSEKQIKIFNQIQSFFDSNLTNHICNTAGIIENTDAHFDMVRTGIGLYGYAPGEVDIPGLIPALTWKTHLVQVNKINKGETVSYGSVWEAPDDGYCGVIPVGYSDGIPRCLSGDFQVSISGKKYPVVGKVTMNYCVVFLGQTELKNGTDVELINNECTARRWAQSANTISYEILTKISSRISRRYINR